MGTTLFNYNNTEISFQDAQGNVMINATQMANAFGKRPAKWLELPSTKEFLKELVTIRKSDTDQLVMTINGGTTQQGKGTWMHEDVAIEFARWLSPKFAIWCNDRIKELMKHGITATPATIDEIIANPDNFIRAIQAIKEEREKNAALLKEREEMKLEIAKVEEESELKDEIIKEKTKEISVLQERTKYLDMIMSSKALLTTSQIALDYGMSAKSFNILLKKYNIQYKQNNQWILKYPHTSEGYVSSRTILLDNGKTILNTQWTQKGRLFLYKFLKRKGILPIIEQIEINN